LHLGVGKGKLDGLLIGRLIEIVGIFLEHPQQAGLASAGGLAHAFFIFIAGNKVQLMGHEFQPFLVLAFQLQPQCCFGIDVATVIAPPGPRPLAVQFEDSLSHRIQQKTVMTDQ